MSAANPSLKNTAAAAVADGLEAPLRHWAALSILLGTFLGNLDASIANVALPTIGRELASAPAATVWVVNAYQLALVIAVLPVAALAESIGYKRVYLTGLAVFTLTSVVCAMAPSLHVLIAARALQGLGGAAAATIVPPLLRRVFPQRLAGRGIALLGLTVGLSAAAGPTVAAGVLSLGSWRWLFAVNLPLGALAIGLAGAILPRSEPTPREFETVGAILNALALALLVLGVGSLGAPGGNRNALIMIAAGLVVVVALIMHQRKRTAPLLPLDLLRSPLFALSAGTSICSYTAQSLALLSLPFLLQHELARTAAVTGLLITPWPLAIVFIAPLTGRLSDRYPAGVLSSIGLGVMALGLLALTLLPAAPDNAQIAWRVALCGIGFGFFQTPNNRMMLTSGPKHRGGAAGGMMTMARMIGMTLGAALATVLFESAGAKGAVTALATGTGVAALGALISCSRLFDTGKSAVSA